MSTTTSEATEEEPVTPAGRLFMEPGMNCYILCALVFKQPIDLANFKQTLLGTLVNHKRFQSVIVSHCRIPTMYLCSCVSKLLGFVLGKRSGIDDCGSIVGDSVVNCELWRIILLNTKLWKLCCGLYESRR